MFGSKILALQWGGTEAELWEELTLPTGTWSITGRSHRWTRVTSHKDTGICLSAAGQGTHCAHGSAIPDGCYRMGFIQPCCSHSCCPQPRASVQRGKSPSLQRQSSAIQSPILRQTRAMIQLGSGKSSRHCKVSSSCLLPQPWELPNSAGTSLTTQLWVSLPGEAPSDPAVRFQSPWERTEQQAGKNPPFWGFPGCLEEPGLPGVSQQLTKTQLPALPSALL